MDDMNREDELETLERRREEILHELEEYNREKDRIKTLLGNLGGKQFSRVDTIINVVFLLIIVVIFTVEITTHLIPAFISLEIGVLLVSIKIVWMIHSQHRFYHFQFWVLNSIEYRVNDIAKRIRKLEKGKRSSKSDSGSTQVGPG